MYDKDYIEYDEYGLKSVNCMRCNTPIRVRRFKGDEIEGERVKVAYIKTLPDFTPVPFMLSDGSYTNILLCADCAKNMKAEEEVEGMTRQFKNGHILDAKHAKRGQMEMRNIVDMYNKLSIGNKVRRIDMKGAV